MEMRVHSGYISLNTVPIENLVVPYVKFRNDPLRGDSYVGFVRDVLQAW